MKVVIANLPWKKFGKIGVRSGSRWPHLRNPAEINYLPFPFFLAYAAVLLKKHGFDVLLIDAIVEGMSYRRFLNFIQKIKPHLFVCETSTVTLEHDLELLVKIGKKIPIALCGPDVNIRQPSFLKKYEFINYVLVGEYEFTLLDLVEHLKENKSLKEVSGIIYRENGEINVNPRRPLINLDELPWPLREGLPMQRYNDTPGDMPLPSVQMWASRGCPYRCKFCLWPQVMYQGNHYRTRSIRDVVDEMEYLVKVMKFKSVYFDDDTFNIGKQRMLKLCDEIKRRKLDVPWAIMARADLMDEEILTNMRESGLFAIKYGVESATQELLDGINKNMDIKRTIEVIKFTKMLAIKTHLTFTFGLPGETKETIRKTIELALELDPTSIQFSITTPFPGTSFYEDMKNKGHIFSQKWSEYDGNNKSVICTDNLTQKDLEYAIKFAYKQWAVHCSQRRTLKKISSFGHYYQLFFTSLKKYGFLKTLLKIFRFLTRQSISFSKNRLGFCSKKQEKEIEKKGLKAGRLSLIFDRNGISLRWEGRELTRGAGFLSAVNMQNRQLHESSLGCWDFEKINSDKFQIKTKYGILPVEETWTVEVIDEKQINWNVEIYSKEQIEILERKVALIFSEQYRKWIDAWGEGYFPRIDDCTEVELRNPLSNFVGLRGRKKLKGQLPTILLELYKDNGDFYPSIKNAVLPLGARMLEVGSRDLNGNAKIVTGKFTVFSGRIKIVEEDFNKRKSQSKK